MLDLTPRKVHHGMTKIFLAIVCALAPVSAVLAQQDSGGSMDEIESLFSKEEDAPAPQTTPKPSTTEPGAPAKAVNEDELALPESGKAADFKDVSDLGRLQAFKDIAVISRRFLPKTNRWEFFIGPTLNLNDAFFANFGANARLGYYFRERYGIEALATLLTVDQRQVTLDLERRGVQTSSFITARDYFGLDFKWAPIYGKMTLQNKNITPFDLYFSFGLGLTGTNQGDRVSTLHLGAGQIFARSKASAFRWDFSWYMFQTASKLDASKKQQLFHNLLFTVGWSWFFPEATYR